MKSNLTHREKFGRGAAYLFTFGAAFGLFASVLLAWVPYRTPPLHPGTVAILPDFMLWAKANEASVVHTCIICATVLMTYVATKAWGGQSA